MKIAIDCRPLQTRYVRRGVGTATRNLLSHLVQSRCSSSLVVCGKSLYPPLRCSEYRMLKRPASHDWFWEQARWPFDLIRMNAGIMHSTVSLGLLREIGLPLITPAKRIATVHDLTPLRLPELAPHTRMNSFRIQAAAVRNSALVIVPSDFVRNDLVTLLRVNEKKIRVVRWAVDETLARAFDMSEKAAVPASDRPFILAMGEDANKNIVTVIDVFERLAAKGFLGDLRIIGSEANQTDRVKQLLAANGALQERVIFTGDLSAEQVAVNLAGCSLFLYPSLFEGFGLPVLEAMYCGAPVITSNRASLPEVGGDAAVYCDPENSEAIAGEAARLLSDDGYRKTIVDNGKRHAKKRSWSEAAEAVLEMYEELGWKKG